MKSVSSVQEYHTRIKMRKKMLEICCVNLIDCVQAKRCGADRIELCSSMAAGGLTPSLGLFQMVKARVSIPIMVMLRVRGAGYCYSDEEFEIMEKDAEIFLSNGVSGCVFGILNADKTIDQARTTQLTERIHRYGKEAVFHRAFDECFNKEEAIASLIACGVDRILTAGGLGNAQDHLDDLLAWETKYGNDISLQVCGAIRNNTLAWVVNHTKIHQVHSACRMFVQDVSDDVQLDLGYHNAYDCVDPKEVRLMVEKLKDL